MEEKENREKGEMGGAPHSIIVSPRSPHSGGEGKERPEKFAVGGPLMYNVQCTVYVHEDRIE